MENDEEKIEEAFTPVDIILAFIIPFILFWGGMLAPVFTASIYLWCLSLIPFYAYLLAFVRPSMAIIQAFEGIFFPKVA